MGPWGRTAWDLKLELPEVQDEARRRLIRQATAANQAIAKGNCLMVMHMLHDMLMHIHMCVRHPSPH